MKFAETSNKTLFDLGEFSAVALMASRFCAEYLFHNPINSEEDLLEFRRYEQEVKLIALSMTEEERLAYISQFELQTTHV